MHICDWNPRRRILDTKEIHQRAAALHAGLVHLHGLWEDGVRQGMDKRWVSRRRAQNYFSNRLNRTILRECAARKLLRMIVATAAPLSTESAFLPGLFARGANVFWSHLSWPVHAIVERAYHQAARHAQLRFGGGPPKHGRHSGCLPRPLH